MSNPDRRPCRGPDRIDTYVYPLKLATSDHFDLIDVLCHEDLRRGDTYGNLYDESDDTDESLATKDV